MLCNDCRFYRAVADKKGYCYNEPPKVLLMPMAVNKPNIAAAMQQEVSMQPISVRPVVGEMDYCSKWNPRPNKEQS